MTQTTTFQMEQGKRRLQRAQEAYQAATAKLYRRDGQPLYSAQEMRERQQAAGETLQQEIDAVRQLATQAQQVTAARMQVGTGDRLTTFTVDELTRANCAVSNLVRQINDKK